MKKILSVFLSFITVVSVCALYTPASACEESYDINPLYANCIDAERLFEKKPPYKLMSDSSIQNDTVFNDYKSAAEFIRDCMVNRIESVTVSISKSASNNLVNVYRNNPSSVYYAVYGAFSFCVANGDFDGDYLQAHYLGASCTSFDSADYVTYKYTLRYDTNADEERAVSDFVKGFADELKAKNVSRLKQIKAIHDKICSITDYDWDNYNNNIIKGDSSVNTAYSAVALGKTMCEGYSSLFYAVCREMQIPVRIVFSDTHAWNIVKPTDSRYYYNIDLTWDDHEFPYEETPFECRCFLKCDADMSHIVSHRGFIPEDNSDHNRVAYYSSDYFNENFPIDSKTFYENDNGNAVCPYCASVIEGAEPTCINHNYVKTSVGATCVNDGKDVFTCTLCGDSYEVIVKATGIHSFKRYKKYCIYGCKTVNPNYEIKAVSLTAKAKKKAAGLKWNISNGTGYQLQYSQSKKFKNKKTVIIKGRNTLSKTVKKLKKNKKYYFRIRAYDKVNGVKKYSKWSKIKSVKVK